MNEANIVKSDYIDESGFYVIENYDKKLPFASFLSGISGTSGIPMWSFYVNRGQAMSSIGIRDKNNCIMEFFPANEAYKMVGTNGFRTFLKIINNDKEVIFEPFAIAISENIKRTMKIKNNELKLIEINNDMNLKVEITYFTIPNEEFAALGRHVKVTNKSGNNIRLEILDGLGAILPYGSENASYKIIGNTLRSWMQGEIKEDNTAIYKVRSTTGDTAKMGKVDNSYFYVAFDEKKNVLAPIVDPAHVFGYDSSLREAINFKENSIENILNNKETCYNKVPCAFTGKLESLEKNQSVSIYSYIGYMNNSKDLNKALEKICNKDYFESKVNEGNLIIDNITSNVDSKTAYPLFDEYIKQCYIDNVLRGGYPLELGNVDKKIYYVYSRKHGDLERDYNFFSIEPNFYSQGNGNFRDVNQNRRMDSYIHPFIGNENIKLFSDLIQLDGYNPLVIEGKKFFVNKNQKQNILNSVTINEAENLKVILDEKFTVGELYASLRKIDKIDNNRVNELMNNIIDLCEEEVEADFREGFWIDHWTYNLDLIEEYIDIYPDKLRELLIEDESYKFFNSPEYVLPRKYKYTLEEGKVRQYLSLAKKENNITPWVNDVNGNVYKTNLLVKLFMLAGVKFMTLDSMGLGIEMEAGKPGWNDAMNGLPGLLGSSFAETIELKRLLLFIKDQICIIPEAINVPQEFYDSIMKVHYLTVSTLKDDLSQIEYWEKVSDIRENYREQVKYCVSGINNEINKETLSSIIDKMILKIDLGVKNVKNMNEGNIPTFMYYDVVNYEIDENKIIKPLEFKVNFLPMFLEGPARYLKTNLEEKEKVKLYNVIKNSNVYDEKLKMYKTSESLEDVSFEIGRARSFTAGWLERESIFMHMEFKYILELIKNGLNNEFFEDIKTAMPPFMNPEVYGRSILENSSFIASSENPDITNHGRGFIARLSGTTVEILNIWKLMMVGKNLFRYENNILKFKPNPILTKDFFSDGVVVTTLLGKIKLIYINLNNKDTFGENKGCITEFKIIDLNNNEIIVKGDEITCESAEKIRDCKIKEITAYIN